ncbi:MAG: ABC transporter ATP-binding protein [Chloroflexota bacterium]|nr:ABC transporter ATP-binding protein [Chloroflexota bacterium]
MQELAIETLGLTRRYGGLIAVDQLNLGVPRESVYGFLGPNGAGKTTTIRMLLGLICPDEGQIWLFNTSPGRRCVGLLQRIGSLVETPSLYPHLTGYENLEVTRRLLGARHGQIDHALAIVRLQPDAHRLVRGYSQGMRQRLGLALALLNEPEMLILDEPTNGLDPAGIHEMRALIRRLPEEHGITVFLSSHLLSEVEQVATHIGIIHKGRLLFQGTLDELQVQRQAHVMLSVDRPKVGMRVLTEAGWIVQRMGNHRLAVAANGHSDAARINALLFRQGLDVFHLSLEQPSLEDIFLKLTNEQDAERSTL